MTTARTRLTSDALMHYASPYYDPVKAHEYYMAHRVLKGRKRSTADLNDEGKEIWATTKENITAEKKEKIAEKQSERDREVKRLRIHAQAARERITAKLKRLNDALTAAETQRRKIESSRNDLQIQIIRNNSSLSAREKQEKIAAVRASSKEKRENASTKLKTAKSANTEDARTQRTKVAADLKSAVSAAREAFKTAKTDLTSSYEDIYQAEFEKIKEEYAKSTRAKKTGNSK